MCLLTSKYMLDIDDLNKYSEGVIKFGVDFYIKAIDIAHARILKENLIILKTLIKDMDDILLQMKYKLILIGIECDLSYQIDGGRYE